MLTCPLILWSPINNWVSFISQFMALPYWERGSNPVMVVHFSLAIPIFPPLHISWDLASLCFSRLCLSRPTHGIVFCVDVFAIYKHGVMYQAHFVVYIFLFFHSVTMISIRVLFAVSTSCRHGTIVLPALSPTGIPLGLASWTSHCCLLWQLGNSSKGGCPGHRAYTPVTSQSLQVLSWFVVSWHPSWGFWLFLSPWCHAVSQELAALMSTRCYAISLLPFCWLDGFLFCFTFWYWYLSMQLLLG